MYEVETLIVAIIGACFGALGALYYLGKALYDRYNLPKFRAFYPDGSTKLNCRIGEEERRICINVENYGRRGAKVDQIFFYFPKSFEIKRMVRHKEFTPSAKFEGGGIFDDYHYISAPVVPVYFSPKEKYEVYFDIKPPKKGGLYSIFITGFPTNLKGFVLELKLALV